MTSFYITTVHLVSWLGSLPHAPERVAGQSLANPNTWNNSALQTLKQIHCNLLTHYNCSEWVPEWAQTCSEWAPLGSRIAQNGLHWALELLRMGNFAIVLILPNTQ
jgi:hypothetical protein